MLSSLRQRSGPMACTLDPPHPLHPEVRRPSLSDITFVAERASHPPYGTAHEDQHSSTPKPCASPQRQCVKPTILLYAPPAGDGWHCHEAPSSHPPSLGLARGREHGQQQRRQSSGARASSRLRAVGRRLDARGPSSGRRLRLIPP